MGDAKRPIAVLPRKVMIKNVTSLLPGRNFQRIFNQYYQMEKNIHTSYNRTTNRKQDPLKVPQNLL